MLNAQSTSVCTLFEGDYHLGVAALANSLFRFGYRGDIHVGYRGALPRWMLDFSTSTPSRPPSPDGIAFSFHQIDTPWHLANYKPQFIKSIFASNPTVQAVFYFDPDIVIKCPWSYYEEWVQTGMALVEEIATYKMSYNHPIRRKWMAVAAELEIRCHPAMDQYFNSGFIGLLRSCERFLDDWEKIITVLPNYGIDLSSFMPLNRPHPFCGPDQDALNIVAMAAEPFLSTIGPEGMDLRPGGFTMSHAVGSPKPWRKKYLISALRGIKPSAADKAFWENAETPIPAFPAVVVRNRRAMIRLASLIGRFYHQ
jgi:hypothetical protein